MDRRHRIVARTFDANLAVFRDWDGLCGSVRGMMAGTASEIAGERTGGRVSRTPGSRHLRRTCRVVPRAASFAAPFSAPYLLRIGKTRQRLFSP
jgi:hypothetical protein